MADKIKTVAVLGVGAVGSYMFWGLSAKPDVRVFVIAEGERATRLKTQGLVINDEQYYPAVKSASEARGVDLLIVSVKYTALRESLDDIKTIVGPDTIVLSLINGVDSEDIIAEAIGYERIVHSLIFIASERRGNCIRFDAEATIGVVYGEKNLSTGTYKTDRLSEMFEGSMLHTRCSDDIISEIWGKFRLNVPSNQIQAVIGCGLGAYVDSAHAAFLRQKMIEEVDAVAAKLGIRIKAIDELALIGTKVKKRARYSTLQDLDNGRHTEVDMFAGAMVRMGRELGVPTPYNEYTYHLIKAIEEKNDGKFNYE
ncbi:MAG: 2-dehydropantoate 2-reductase [Lachnospiraceae bacterium]|nr:2-dehydropantoate 2-reductase [Lachnospiraceae bacterium]